MIWHYVLAAHFVCPFQGWPKVGPKIQELPIWAKVLVCQHTDDVVLFDKNGERRAVELVRELGPGAKMMDCRGLRCQKHNITWKTVMEEGS